MRPAPRRPDSGAAPGALQATPARRLPVALRLGADLLIGAAAALGQAPWGLWPVTVLALAALIWRVATAPSSRAAAWRALAIGAGHFALALAWITQPFLVEADRYGWMSPIALLLTALGGALFWSLPALAAHRFGWNRTSRAAALALALLVSDWLRGWIFTGLPWALTGHVWIDTPAGQIAAWLGAPGLSALTLAAALLPVLGRTRRGIATGAGLSAALIALAWGAGLARLAQPLPPDRDQIVRLVQPNADQTLKWDPFWAPQFYDRLTALSALPLDPALGEGRPDLVVWPETAVPFLLNEAGPALQDIAAQSGATTLVGIQRSDGAAWFNSLAEFTPDARIGAVYDKFHLVPFGEYIPWGDALARFGITAFAAQHGNGYSRGPGPQVMAVEGLPPFQPLICYEAIFERHLLRGQRPEWILQVTNDAWFGTWSGPYQHLAQARLRAIQSGLPLLRAANTGVSAVIDARGGLRTTLALNRDGVLDAALPGALPPTLWWRWGDLPMLALMALAAAALAIARHSRRSH